MSNLRLFIGLSLSPAVTGRLSVLMDRMAPVLSFRKWTHPDDLHVTLHFLGDTPGSRMDAIQRAIAETAAGTAPFALTLTRPDTFGAPDAPRILWLGLAEPDRSGALARLHRALAPGLKAAGCALEERPYRAHVTLARQGGAGFSRQAALDAWQTVSESWQPLQQEPLQWTAAAVTLFQSHLGRRPSYEKIREFPLSGED